MPDTTTLNESTRTPIDGSESVRLATAGANWKATLSAIFSALSPAAANPTASVGLTAVNGSAATFMRSDGAPPYDPNAAFAFAGLAATVISQAAVGATPLTVAGGSLGAGSTVSFQKITGTWNDSGTTFAGALLINITNTASAAASKIVDIQIGGVTQFNVNRQGSGTFAANLTIGGDFRTATNGIVAWSGRSQITSPVDGQFLFQSNAATNGFSLTASSSPGVIQHGAADAAVAVPQGTQVQSIVAGTTDTAGGDWTRRASLATGTGAGGNIVEKTGFSAKSTGTSQNTAVDREIIVAKGKVLTSGAAFSIADIALPTLSMCGGAIEATIVCTDGTDMQSFTQTVTYSAVNKGAAYTTSITPSTGDKSVSAGTLTTSWTIVSGTNKITIKVTPTTSLTPSTNSFLLYYRIKNNSEQATTIL